MITVTLTEDCHNFIQFLRHNTSHNHTNEKQLDEEIIFLDSCMYALMHHLLVFLQQGGIQYYWAVLIQDVSHRYNT